MSERINYNIVLQYCRLHVRRGNGRNIALISTCRDQVDANEMENAAEYELYATTQMQRYHVATVLFLHSASIPRDTD